MNKKRLVFCLVALIGPLSFLSSCDKDDDSPCTTLTWYEDADEDGLGNLDVAQDACEQPTGYVANADDTDDTDANTYRLDESYFNSSALISFKTVNCTLEDGSSTTCYEMVFRSNPVEDGPYCPQTIDDIGGVGIYDGATNPGFQVMKRSLWEAMEADGYDLVDADGNITIVDPGNMSAGPPPSGGACLEATPDDNLELTFLIPTEPVLLASPDQLRSVENLGVSIDGIPLTGDPPSATQGMPGRPGGGGAIPSIDPCGGHIDPFGYYHLHFIPQEMNNVLQAHNITEVACTNFAQDETLLVGFAKDGFPIYASKDSDGTLPTDLDECNGHVGPTPDFPGEIYHYHASSTEAPNVPPCLVGASVAAAFSYQ
ncbi:MAG: YHYH protein [Bacteroidota bacterium]